MLSWVIRDTRFAIRNLRRTPGFATAAIVTLALGIGANTAIFSVVNGVVLRPLDYPEPDRLAMVSSSWADDPEARGNMSQPDLRDLQESATSLVALAGYSTTGLTLTGMGEAEVVDGARVTDGLTGVFQIAPILGRDIRTEENVPNGPLVVLVSHAFWQERFSGAADIVGRNIALNGRSHEIVGVAPQGFSYPRDVQLWVPLHHDEEGCGRSCHFLRTIARLTPNTSYAQAGEELRAIGSRLEETYPENNFEKSFAIQSLGDAVYGDVRVGLLVILGAVVLVLLIACANVANLLLVRGAIRAPEIAVRAALGASRGGLIRQLMLEALVLAGLGGLVGVALARVGVAVLVNVAPSTIPRLDEVTLDTSVLMFVFGSIAFITLLFGLVPAIRISGTGVARALHEGGRGTHGGQTKQWFRSALLVAEIAISLVLLSGAGLLLKSFARLQAVDLGFVSENAISFGLSLPGATYDGPDAAVQFFERLEDRLRANPRIEQVGSVLGRPLGGNRFSVATDFLDRPPVPEGQQPDVAVHVVTPEYLSTIGVPLVRGRMLLPTDRIDDGRVAVVSQRMAARFYPDVDPIGKQIRLGIGVGYDVGDEPITIVGIVADVRTRSVTQEPVPEAYLAQAQMGSSFLSVVVRGVGSVSELLPSIRREIRAIDPNLPIRSAETLNETVSRAFGSARFHLTLLMVFAGVAVALAAVGLYGVVAYLVSQRRHEIGVRIALGATSGDVVRLVLRQATRPVLIGLAVGIGGTISASRVLNSLLYEVPARDPSTVLIVTILLGVVALAAVMIPARKASRIAPLMALRND